MHVCIYVYAGIKNKFPERFMLCACITGINKGIKEEILETMFCSLLINANDL